MSDDGAVRRPGATRRRGEELVHAIHDAAIEELLAVGVDRMTMEGIARRAATAKTSLYRRWPSPHEVLVDAFLRVFPQEEPSPSTDDLRGDLVRALRMMRDWMSSLGARAVAEVVTARDRHPELVEAVYARVFGERGGRFTQTVLLHYAEHGVVDPARLTPVVLDIGEALIIKYGLDHDHSVPPDDAYIDAVVDQAILPALGLPPGGD
ncbi:TetR/AcrR family transcriptional regulator [Streptomonospora sp. S1-112]|uniref:TetR/AcrR family transcriptional regulator n=1 Tax=Streptomonospora mangrovi TaxID=2883123 RepID=A0A9X3SE23_9ACTN|nr:TetR/AcrR family transcriptional regulator [Streptomonospora mangrovi]MDA0565483.1 TetR/AcrR family transcriptional regulator [Streptomonospora mangrovi]